MVEKLGVRRSTRHDDSLCDACFSADDLIERHRSASGGAGAGANIGWQWLSTRPGRTVQPNASSVGASGSPIAASTAAVGPTAAIRPSRIATAPFSIRSRCPSLTHAADRLGRIRTQPATRSRWSGCHPRPGGVSYQPHTERSRGRREEEAAHYRLTPMDLDIMNWPSCLMSHCAT